MNGPDACANVEPVSKMIRVNAKPAHAFEVFSTGMGRWWLRGHSINPTKSPIANIVIEPRSGGRWYELGEDGSECNWGHVLVWEPPTRLVLVWQISAQWTFDPTLLTEVEIRFIADAAGGTEVRLEHRNLERFGEAAAKLRTAIDSDAGWSGLLESYAMACA